MSIYAPNLRRIGALLSLVSLALMGSGCAGIIGRATQGVASNLSSAIENHDDPATVQAALPTYLLMLDGLIEGDLENPALLMTGARLYGVYAGVFVDDPDRAKRLSTRAFGYAGRAFCPAYTSLCESRGKPFEEFVTGARAVPARDVGPLYAYAAAWAGLIQADSGNWSMIADIPKVQALLEHVVALQPAYENGQPQLYLGVLSTLLPAAYGGKPEQGRAYFETALTLSGGRNQMVRVLYAQHYARLVFDRELHDALVDHVLAADPVAPRLTLINRLAQSRAAELKASANDYF